MLITDTAMIFYVHRVIARKGEDYPQKLSRHGYQSLYLLHTPANHLLIWLMQNPIGLDHIDGPKIQQFPQQTASSFGDSTLPPVFARTDLKKIKACQFGYFRDRPKRPEVSNFSDQSSCSYFSDPFNREDTVAIGNFFQMFSHLLFQIGNKAMVRPNLGGKVLYFQENAMFPFLDPSALPGSMEKRLCPLRSQFTSAGCFNDRCQPLTPKRHNAFAVRMLIDQIRAVFVDMSFIILQNSGKIIKIRSWIG